MNWHNVAFICMRDLRYTLREKSTLLWLFLMPVVFIYFIGTATGGFGGNSDRPDRIAVKVPANAGLLGDRVLMGLEKNNFEVVRFDAAGVRISEGELAFDRYARQLVLPPDMTAKVTAGEQVELGFSSSLESIGGDFDNFRVQRAVYTVLADVVAAARSEPGFGSEGLAAVDATTRKLVLLVEPAGNRKTIPSGFAQAVPGILVMFTLLVLMTSGATLVFNEREQGLLRRLAATPISRMELVSGKWLGKSMLGFIQIGFAMLAGVVLFEMDWGPDLWLVFWVLALWAMLCASVGLWLGSVGRSEGQVSGVGVLSANLLAGLGGCWWPIEIAPQWMQSLQKFLPTGWVMDALHQAVNFQSGFDAVVPNLIALTISTLLMAWLAVRYFQYQ
jgi:ABC-type multidrug transport system permease subunit